MWTGIILSALKRVSSCFRYIVEEDPRPCRGPTATGLKFHKKMALNLTTHSSGFEHNYSPSGRYIYLRMFKLNFLSHLYLWILKRSV